MTAADMLAISSIIVASSFEFRSENCRHAEHRKTARQSARHRTPNGLFIIPGMPAACARLSTARP
jgi:hypothetical protein